MKEGQPHPEKRTLDACLAENREALSRLAGAGEAKQLMELLGRQGEVRQAAQAAARGDAGELMAMMGRLMDSREGARLVEQIRRRAREAGL